MKTKHTKQKLIYKPSIIVGGVCDKQNYIFVIMMFTKKGNTLIYAINLN